MIKKRNIPEVRFKGFSNDWLSQDFDDFFDFSISKNNLSRANLTTYPTEVKNIHYGDILINFGSVVDVVNDVDTYIKNAKIDQHKNQLLKDGDVIFADAAEDETVGKSIEIRGVSNQNIVSGLHTIPCRPIKQVKPFFLGHYLNSNSYHRQLLPLMQGTKVLSISKSSLIKTSLNIPEAYEEQKKIGIFFQNVDRLIDLHSKKYEKLLNVKKAMFEKMFPKEGADVPEIRFKQFQKKWAIDDIENVCTITTGSKNTQDSIKDGIYPFFVRSQTVERIDSYCFDGEAVLTAGDGVGTGKVFHYINGKFNVHQRVYMMSNFREDVDGYYFYLFFSINFYARVMQMTAKSSVDSVRKEMIAKMKIKIPEKEEQVEIGNFFFNLNKQISLQKQKLAKLKNIKKAKLEKMFV